MLPVRFDEIGSDDILRLVEEKITERRTLEYKQQLTIDRQDDKAEFLGDISSFANASGGEIFYGISDERDAEGNATGIPAEVVGLSLTNSSAECDRIERLIETGIQPRIPVIEVKPINVPDRGTVIVVRVGKSWVGPHMVSYANRTRFYSRNSGSGKQILDVQQIGAAFALQRGLGERLREWKADRIAKALTGEGPALLKGPAMLLHFVSGAALNSESVALPRTFDAVKWGPEQSLISFMPQFTRYNADGYLLVLEATASQKQSYLQIFKDGRLEYGDSYMFNGVSVDAIPSQILESGIVKTFGNAIQLLSTLEIPGPLFVSLTLIGMKGKPMAMPTFPYVADRGSFHNTFDRDVIVCPDIRVEKLDEGYPYPTTLLPIINSVWQAAGVKRSPFTDPDGTWRPT
jgi:hypothetical protein